MQSQVRRGQVGNVDLVINVIVHYPHLITSVVSQSVAHRPSGSLHGVQLKAIVVSGETCCQHRTYSNKVMLGYLREQTHI